MCCQHVPVGLTERKQALVDNIDAWAMWISPPIFVLFNIIYWIYYRWNITNLEHFSCKISACTTKIFFLLQKIQLNAFNGWHFCIDYCTKTLNYLLLANAFNDLELYFLKLWIDDWQLFNDLGPGPINSTQITHWYEWINNYQQGKWIFNYLQLI